MGLLDSLFGNRGAKPKVTPVIGFRNPSTIAANAEYLFDFESEAKTRDFYPFANVKVLNNDTANIIEVYINGSNVDFFTVLNRASEVYSGTIRSVLIRNLGSTTIVANAIILNLWNE